jgi:hypothetical protein
MCQFSERSRLSVNDRLIDELAQQTPIPCARGTWRLRHQYGNEILGGIDPEVRARIAYPILVDNALDLNSAPCSRAALA